MPSFGKTLKHAWNAFTRPPVEVTQHSGTSSWGGLGVGRPDRVRFQAGGERTIIASIYTRLGIDVASVPIRHVRVDENDRYESDIKGSLTEVFTKDPNIDQGPRQFRQDLVMTLFDRGLAAIVPVDTSLDPRVSTGFEIKTMRVGWVMAFHPAHVRVSVYNDKAGVRQEITLPKSTVAIIENPLYTVMNEPNSTLQRIIRKLSILDAVDEQSGSGKLDLIIQLPYTIRSEGRRVAAEQRRIDIESQLRGSKYGIAYTDGTEKITQLNRAVDNNMMQTVKDLMEMLYTQLGLTPEVMAGTADEAQTLNYWNRTIEPILDSIVEEVERKFLTKTARSQKQAIRYFRDPFKLVPIANIAEIADKFTRNEILSSNEIRGVMGFAPSDDPKAKELRNSNLNHPDVGQIGTKAPSALPPGTDVIEVTAEEVV